MNQSKYIFFVIILVFLSVIWNLQNHSYIQTFDHQQGDLGTFSELLYYMNNSATGYSSIQNYALVYLLPFLFFMQQFIGKDTIVVVTRTNKREGIFLREAIAIQFIAMLFAICHSAINVVWTVVYFPVELIIESRLMSSVAWNTICLYLFYSGVGLIYASMKNLLRSSGLGLLGTLVLVGGGFFVSKMILTTYWTPLIDLNLLSNLLDGNANSVEIFWTYLKQVIILFVFYLIGSALYTRKDFL
ncbi:WxPxxD family membrane protein [Terribacillus goriensis]|uniref:WxPxxD family membrane protein n=1 Tax=Terribacillus saccharophilus TaxID=361277 RepID=UPI00398362F9